MRGMFRYLSGTIGFFNAQKNIPITDERPEILAWLSPLDPRTQHKKVQTKRIDKVGDWFLETKEFRSWCDSSGTGSDSAALLCCGDSGVGKTFISSLVIDKLCDQARRKRTAVVCFYLDRASQREQSPTDVLGSLLKRLVSGLEKIPKEVVEVFQDQKMAIGGRQLGFAQTAKLFQTITSSQRTIMCVDAIDECAPEHCFELLNSLRQILRVSPGTRLFLTGRPHIRGEIEKVLAGTVTTVSISPRKDDIITFIRSRLERDINPDAMDGTLAADIIRRIPEAASELFPLVSLSTEAVLRETTIHHRRQKLDAITDGSRLGDTHGTMLGRIKAPLVLPSSLGDGKFSYGQETTKPPFVAQLQTGSSQYNSYSNNETNGDSRFEFEQVWTLPGNLNSNHKNDHKKDEDSCFRCCDSNNGSLETGQNRPFHTCNLFDSPEYPSCHNTVGSSPWRIGGSRDSGVDSYELNPLFTLHGNPSNFPYQNPSARAPQTYTPVQHSPHPSTPLGRGSHSLSQPTGSSIIDNGYFPIYHSGRQPADEADYPSQVPYSCHCGAQFGRRTDFARHQLVAKRHGAPAGPACPIPGCTFLGRFTRVDNFKVHYMRQHGKDQEEADKYIQDWKSRQTYVLGRDGRHATMLKCEGTTRGTVDFEL